MIVNGPTCPHDDEASGAEEVGDGSVSGCVCVRVVTGIVTTTVPVLVTLRTDPPEVMLDVLELDGPDGRAVGVEVDVARVIEVPLTVVLIPGNVTGVEVDVASSVEVLLDQDVGVVWTPGRAVGVDVDDDESEVIRVLGACGKAVGVEVEVASSDVIVPEGSYTLFGIGSAPGGFVSRIVVSKVLGSVTSEPCQLLHHDAHCPSIRAKIIEHVCLFSKSFLVSETFDADVVVGPTVTVSKYVVRVTTPSSSILCVVAAMFALLAGVSHGG